MAHDEIRNVIKVDGAAPTTRLPVIVPLHLHPTTLGSMCDDPDSAWRKWGVPKENGAAWDFVWAKGGGRRPWEGGDPAAFDLVYELGIRFNEVPVGDYLSCWFVQAAVEGEWDIKDDDEWIDVGASEERVQWMRWCGDHPELRDVTFPRKDAEPESESESEPEAESEPTMQEVYDRVLAGAMHEIAACWAWKHNTGKSNYQPPPLLLVPMDMHPCDLGDGMENHMAWATEDLALDYGNAWDQLWMEGEGRRPCFGGHERGFERARTVAGVQFVPVTIGGREVWLPRATNTEVWWDDSDDGDAEPEEKGRLQEKEVGFELLIDGRSTSAEELAEPRKLSPGEPGCVEGRGWMTWCNGAGIAVTVGDA